MTKKFKLLLAVMLIGTVGIVPTQVGAVEQELKIQNDDFELYGVDATTYNGYVYFKHITNFPLSF